MKPDYNRILLKQKILWSQLNGYDTIRKDGECSKVETCLLGIISVLFNSVLEGFIVVLNSLNRLDRLTYKNLSINLSFEIRNEQARDILIASSILLKKECKCDKE